VGDVEPIVIILLTYGRSEYCRRTIEAVKRHLRYPDLLWYVGDGGSEPEHLAMIAEQLQGQRILGRHTGPHAETSYGRDANIALDKAHQHSRLVFVLEDDWELGSELDLRPFADMLLNNDDVGMVRLGYLQEGMAGETWGWGGHLYWRLKRDSPSAYVFTGHPSLRHVRFRDAYGRYQEALRPGETELAMAWQFREGTGPGIVFPVEIGAYGPFGHIGEHQSYT
jgi:hypothetical protein